MNMRLEDYQPQDNRRLFFGKDCLSYQQHSNNKSHIVFQ